jgi:hypothetical protein
MLEHGLHLDTEISHALFQRLAGLTVQQSETQLGDQERAAGEFLLTRERTQQLTRTVGVAAATGPHASRPP